MNIMNGTGIAFYYGESSATDDESIVSSTLRVSAPGNEDDMSVLPGGVAPAAGTAYEAYAAGIYWSIVAGETTWSQSVRATES